MDRRSYLRYAGAVGLPVLGSGCGVLAQSEDDDGNGAGQVSTDPEDPPHADEFGTVVNVVEAGADPTGEDPVDDVLAASSGDDVLLYLPAGEYHLAEKLKLPSFSNLGVVGDGATIRPPDGYSDYLLDLGRRDRASDLLVEGLRFDFRARETGARALNLHVDDGLGVRDVTAVGVQDTDQTVARTAVTSPDGTGTVERLRMPDGGATGTASTGCLVPPVSRGTLRFVDCHFAGFPDNGLYASPSTGPVRVLGGLYADSGVANIRVSGDSVVRGARIRCQSGSESFPNMRGIRVDGGNGTLIERCDVELIDVTGSDGGIVCSAETGAVTVRDTRVRVEADEVAAVLAKTPDSPNAGGRLRCENVRIEGSAAGGQAVSVYSREGSVLDSVTICQPGDARDGVFVANSENTVVRKSSISVTGRPVVTRGPPVTVRDIETDLSLDACLASIDPCPGLGDAVQEYAGSDCAVSTTELSDAIADWSRGALTTNQLRSLIRVWAMG